MVSTQHTVQTIARCITEDVYTAVPVDEKAVRHLMTLYNKARPGQPSFARSAANNILYSKNKYSCGGVGRQGQAQEQLATLTLDFAEGPDAESGQESIAANFHLCCVHIVATKGAKRPSPSVPPSASGGVDILQKACQPIPVRAWPPNTPRAIILPRDDAFQLIRETTVTMIPSSKCCVVWTAV